MAYKDLSTLASATPPSPTLSDTQCIPATLAFSQLLEQIKLFSASWPWHMLFSVFLMPFLPTHHLTVCIHPSGLHLTSINVFPRDEPVLTPLI